MHGLIESWVNDIRSAHVQLCFEEVVDKESAVVQYAMGAYTALGVQPRSVQASRSQLNQ